MEEIWKDIEDYEGIYQISNLGRVKSLSRKDSIGREKKEKLRKIDLTTKGYPTITLYKDGKAKHKLIHRLVAIAFIPNPNNYPVVNHKDENPLNCRVDNLEWCTYLYNNTYGKSFKNRFKKVTMYNIDGTVAGQFDSMNEASIAIYGDISSASSITLCCQGKLIQHCGHVWRYGNDPFDLYKTPSLDNIKSKRRCSVCQYNLQGELINSYISLIEAANAVKGYQQWISKVCKGTAQTHKGYVWRFQGDSFDKFFVPKYKNESISKKVAQYTIDGEFVKLFNSIKEAADYISGKSCSIVDVCKGRQKTHRGYIWKYVDQIQSTI